MLWPFPHCNLAAAKDRPALIETNPRQTRSAESAENDSTQIEGCDISGPRTKNVFEQTLDVLDFPGLERFQSALKCRIFRKIHSQRISRHFSTIVGTSPGL